MKPADYEIEIANWPDDANPVKAVRTAVFIDEQHVPVELEWDGLDPDCIHFIVRHGSKVVATARLKPDGQIGRMAVLKPYRSLGIGRKLLAAVLKYADQAGLETVYCHAQTQVIDFYRASGFTEKGEEFMDAGIPHRAMYKKSAKYK